MRDKMPKYLVFGALFALVLSLLMAIPSKAQLSGVSVDFAAAEPTTYNHLTGGGKWNSGTVNVDIERSLEGEYFACKDKVSYLTKIDISNTSDLQSLGAMTYQLKYSFDLDTTGQSGVALTAPITASINNSSDSASRGDGNSAVSLVSTSTTGPIFNSGSKLIATFNVTDVEANETIVLRIDLNLECKSNATPTGNLQAKYETGFLVFKQDNVQVLPADEIGSGARTVDLKSPAAISVPQLNLAKTVTFSAQSCPGVESILIAPDDYIRYCYVITNPSNVGGKIGAAVYNISEIADDSGEYPDFTVTITSGLDDLDGDGQVDDLAPGATATAEKVLSFDGNKDTTLVNIAVVTGTDAPTGGNTLSATDTATIFIDAPEVLPNIEVLKTGSVATLPETGGSVTFTVVVKNKAVENFQLTSLSDDKFGDLNGVGNCSVPQTISAGGDYSCSFTKELFSNTLTAYTNTVTASGQDPEGNQTSANDSETVNFTDVLPDVSLTKSVDPAMVLWSGGNVNYKFRITNLTLEPVIISTFSDDKVTLSAECLALVGTVIAPTSFVECAINNYPLSSPTDATFVNTATVVASDNEGNTDTANASATVTFARPSIDVEKTPDTQTVDEGLTATFQISVTNTGNVPLTNVTVTDAATPSCDKNFALLAVGATETYSCTTVALLSSFTNVAVATGNYESTQVTDQDSAALVLDYFPKIEVSKTASTNSVQETGGSVTYTVVVKNKAVESFQLNSLVDDKFGDLNGVGTCAVPQTLASDGQYSCSFTKVVSGEALTSHTNIVTGSGQDPEGNQTSANDNEVVNFTDVLPDITLTKVVDPTAARWTGDYVNYRFRITNQTGEAVTITSFTDNAITLSAECNALVGYVLAPFAFVECATNNYFLTGTPGGSFTNTATAVANDNEGNIDTATASAVLKFWWFGRTPGYWKNHPEDWNSGYLPNQFIQDVFTVPSSYLTGGILDLDKNGNKDKLIDGLGYRGGSTLTGSAQIMFRAAIAGLLNEAYYGADYPGATSTAALITEVNSKLATLNRAQLIQLATYYDYWNNAIHSPLPQTVRWIWPGFGQNPGHICIGRSED